MKTKLKELVEIQIGYQHRDRIEAASVGSYQIIQIKDVDTDNRFLAEFPAPAPHRLWMGSLYRVTPKTKPECYRVEAGNVLFLSRGTRYLAIPITPEYVQPFPDSWEQIIAIYFFYILRIRAQGILPEYLAWFLNQPPAQVMLQGISQGSGTTMVSKAAFGDLTIDVPALATQKQIVQLDQLRCKEAFLQKQIEQKRSLLVQAVCLTAMKQEI
jgi:hypothetical protein